MERAVSWWATLGVQRGDDVCLRICLGSNEMGISGGTVPAPLKSF